MSTVAELRTKLDLAGLDLTPAEELSLINEAVDELCVESEWTRANLDLGPTVADQAAYTLPSNLHRILRLRVGSTIYEPTDEEAAVDLQQARRSLWVDGVWWLSFDSSGTESVSLYPTPSSSGTAITAICVVHPTALTGESDDLPTPPDYDRAVANYVKSIAMGDEEDNEQTRDYYLGEFERAKQKLRDLRNSRAARKGATIRITGYTA